MHTLFLVNLTLMIFTFFLAEGSPSSIFWTVCTTKVYSTGIGHVDEDNYFTIFNRNGHDSFFPPDTGLEFGIFSWKKLEAEAGVDYIGGTNHPLLFNAGIGVAEGKLFCHAPSLKVGFFNAGTCYRGHNRTNQNIVDLIVGKTLPDSIGGEFCVGGFSGSRAMGKNRQGYMISYQKSFCLEKYCDNKEYFKWVLCADYASGKNTIGGGGVGVYYYFTPEISILTGPVWFNSKKINGNWKWSIQIDINFSVCDAQKGRCTQ